MDRGNMALAPLIETFPESGTAFKIAFADARRATMNLYSA